MICFLGRFCYQIDLILKSNRKWADANVAVSVKQAQSDFAREQYVYAAGASHIMAVGKILDCIALNDEYLSEESLKE